MATKTQNRSIHLVFILILAAIIFPAGIGHAQSLNTTVLTEPRNDKTGKAIDSVTTATIQALDSTNIVANSLENLSTIKEKQKSKVLSFVPDPKRALWLSLVLPGAGQIYNKKYWKLPIIYGGFIGCTYALLWNQQMYKDYSQAYIDIMDDDPNTASYNEMLPMGYSIEGREDQFKTIFKHKKDFYRRYRDLSIFAFMGVYLISVVDAYIDAQLSTFDISKDLSMKLEPTVFGQKNVTGNSRSVGVQCSFRLK